MLRLERERFGQVGVEVGGALAGDPVDEIERDVVESGITETRDRAPDVVGRRLPLEHVEQVRLEALCAERDARHAVRAEQAASSAVTVSGFASTVTSPASGSAASRRSSSRGSVNVGVPPPRNTVSTSSASTSRSSVELGEQRVDVRRRAARACPTTVTKSQ